MSGLKRCPFCGSTTVKLILENDKDTGRCWYVGCGSCYARGTSFIEHANGRQDESEAYQDITTTWGKAIRAWNRRACETE